MVCAKATSKPFGALCSAPRTLLPWGQELERDKRLK
ncbi:hypothetical protein BM1374166_01966 [Bartonella tribocorum]|nr:hypothetical protein BM1374166_01966 [Bartonella tribocorum]